MVECWPCSWPRSGRVRSPHPQTQRSVQEVLITCGSHAADLSWGERVQVSAGAPFWASEWVELHRGEYFASVVSYLRSLLDAHARTLSAEDTEDVASTFDHAIRLELAFWEDAWGAAGSSHKAEL